VGTSYTYSFAVHAKTDIDWSDKLSSVADIDAVCRRIVVVFNEMWSAAMRDEGNQLRYEPFSFLFGGYTTMLLRCRAWHIVRDSEGVFSARELSLDRCRCAVKPQPHDTKTIGIRASQLADQLSSIHYNPSAVI
jgi:hypothetical protein